MPSAARRGLTSPSAPVAATDVLEEAARLLRRGSYAAVQERLGNLRRSSLEPAVAAAVRQLLAEAHFRAAMLDDNLDDRLRRLTAALAETPDASKLHFHYGITLWQLGRQEEALSALETAASQEPQRPGLAYLLALARIAVGRSWDAARLAPTEANTARLVQRLVQGKPRRGAMTLQEPLLGRGTELWQALIAMREDPTAAPQAQLKLAAEQNTRRPVGRILNYYRGIAALRAGDSDGARTALLYAQGAGLNTPWLTENLTALMRSEIVELAQADRWQDLVNLLGRLPDPGADRILAETGSLAYYHLGYEAAQAGRWQTAAQHWRKANELSPSRHIAQNLALAEEALGNWLNAAEAWRDMVRRRPRKETHPDYLTDLQVAALWRHAADCYQHTDAVGEVETCLRNALKYAPEDTALRMRLADTLLADQRGDAAETQLQEVLAVEPQNLEALLHLARLYETQWNRDPLPIWRQVLAINPTHPEAREAVANSYLQTVRQASVMMPYIRSVAHLGKSNIEVLEAGLREMPDHPRLLAELGAQYARLEQFEAARAFLLKAFQVAPQEVDVVGQVLHELLHARAGDAVENLLPAVRQLPRLLPAFWFHQVTMALQCSLSEQWAELFIEEAVKLAGQPWVEDTRAGLLLEAYDLAYEEKATGLLARLAQRIRQEAPACGAVEYVEAHQLFFDEADSRRAGRLVRTAMSAARQANDAGVLRRVEELEQLLRGGLGRFNLNRVLRDLFGGPW